MIEINWTQLNETINNTATLNYINQTIITPLIETSKYYKNIMWIWFAGFIILFLIILFSYKTFKKTRENRIYIDKKAEEIFKEFKKISEGQKVNEIDIRDLPTPVRENILEHQGLLSKMFFKSNKEGYKPPFLILIRSDKTAEIKQNAKEGELLLQKKDANKTKVRLVLASNKLISLKIGNKRQDFWIAFEDEAECYPHEPKHLAKAFYDIVLALQMAKTGLQKKGKFPKILLIIGAILIILVIIAVWYFNKQVPTETVINQTVNATVNATQAFAENITFKQVRV